MILAASSVVVRLLSKAGRAFKELYSRRRIVLAPRGKLDTLEHLHDELVSRVAVTIAIVGLLLGTNQLLEVRITSQRDAADRSYHQMLANLGSPRLAVRVGAIGQIPVILRQQVPTESPPPWWAGVLYWAVPHKYPTVHGYHESVLSVLQAMAQEPKHGSESAGAETQALIDTLCNIGPEGWYMAAMRRPTVRELCLAWIWKDAPASAISSQPAIKIFRDSCIDGGDFDRLDLTRADFSGAHLTSSYFRDANLSFADFSDAQMEDIDFSRATLRDASFRGARLEGAVFAGADINGADFTDSGVTVDQVARALNPGSARGLL